jgi:ubiquitin C-terminal hydrolase
MTLDEDTRSCPAERPCTAVRKAKIKRFLSGSPHVFTIGLAWESDSPETSVANDMCRLPSIDPAIVFGGEFTESAVYELRGVVLFYGKHYNAAVLSGRRIAERVWRVFDDSLVRDVGAWDNVLSRCVAGHLHPTLLFYVKQSKPK